VLSNLTRTHPRIAVDLFVGTKARPLPLARKSHALTDRSGTFLHPLARNIAVFYGRHLDVQIDPIEQRSGNSLPITLDLERPTSAFPFQIAEITARAGIQARVHSSMKTSCAPLHGRTFEKEEWQRK
jgi:hypothetical protein